MTSLANLVAPGVATGDQVQALFKFAKQQGYAYPAVNVSSSCSINATLEAAHKINSPVIVQFSYSGSAFFMGKGIKLEEHKSSILGTIASAQYVHSVAEDTVFL